MKKLSLNELKVKSFVTSMDGLKKQTVNGGLEAVAIGAISNGGVYCPTEVHRTCPPQKSCGAVLVDPVAQPIDGVN